MKVSVITICRNARGGLQRTVASVLAQSRPPEEYCIQDGASSDASVEGLLDWLRREGKAEGRDEGGKLKAEGIWGKAEMLKWEGEPQNTQKNTEVYAGKTEMRIRSEPDGGIYEALNRGVARATGDVIGLLHAGDEYAHPDVLARVMQAFEGGAEAVYGDLQYVRESAAGGIRVVRHWRSGAYAPRQLRWGWMPPHPALFVRRDVYERIALDERIYFDPTYRCAGDYDFIMRLLTHLTKQPVYIPEVLVHMRTGGVSNRSLAHIWRKSCEDWRAIRRNRIGGLYTLIGKNVRKVGQFYASP